MSRKKGNQLRTAAPVVSLRSTPDRHGRTWFSWIAIPGPQQHSHHAQQQPPESLRASILPAFPDLVDKALQPYPEALDAVARAVKEWYEREDAASRF